MTKITFFRPSAGLDAERNLNDFIAHCRDNLTLYAEDEHDGKVGWESNKWAYKKANKNFSMTFSKYTSNKNNYIFEPFDSSFMPFAKAYIRYKQSEGQVTSIGDKIVVLRTLHDAILEHFDDANILHLDGIIQDEAAHLLNARYPKSDKLFRYGGQLVVLYDFLVNKGISPTLPDWSNPWKRPKSKAESTKEDDRKWQEERCPSQHQMLSLADCFAQAEKPVDLYWSSVISLLMFAPGRAGELAYLTVKSLHEEEGRLGVRWFGQKGFDFSIKWVPKYLEPMVRIAFERLMQSGKMAREAAKFAFENPNRFYRHEGCITPVDFSEDAPLNAVEFAYAMGFSEATIQRLKNKVNDYNSPSAWHTLNADSSKWIKKLRANGNPSYRDLAKHTLEKYKNDNWPNLPNTERPIWESLLLLRDNEVHANHQTKGFSWLIPDVNQLNDQLSSRPMKNPIPTIFERFGLTNEDGSKIEMTSHQPRVWLSTLAERGHMDDFLLAQWAGRARIEDNRHYNLTTLAEREEQVMAIMAFKKRPTALEAIKVNLPVSYEDLGLNRIGIADITEYGMCTHDYAMSPCTKGGECMTCKEHVCIKGMPKTLERVIALEGRVESQYLKAVSDRENNVFGADVWVDHLGWKLSHVRTQRMRMENDETPDGTLLWIPENHDPSAIERSLAQQGLDTENLDGDKAIESIIAGLLGD